MSADPTRQPTRRSVLFGAALSSMLVAAGCSSDSDSSSSSSSGSVGASTKVITANGSEPQNPLIPTATNEVGGGKILDAIFAGLVYYDAKGKPVNDVADSIDSDDQQTYTITIKADQVFSDGSPVTAKGFVDAWNYGALSTNAQLSSYFFEPIEGYEAVQADPPTAQTMSGLTVVDPTTFTVRLAAPTADFPLRLGYSAYYPLPEGALDDAEAFGENPVGNGPYMLKGQGAWQHNVKIDLVPNPKYTGGRKVANGGLSLVFYQSQETAYNDLVTGTLDVLDAVPDSAFGNFESDLGDGAINQPAAIFQSFTIPQTLAHFGGEEGRLRRAAISYAINRPQITKAIFQDTRTPATDFTSPVIAGWKKNVKGNEVLTFDETKAKALWAQAEAMSTYTDTFTIGYNADGGHQGWVDATTNQIANVLGIKAQGKPYPTFAELRTDASNRTITGAFRTGWQADYPGLYNFLAPNYATGAGSNDGDYSNPDFDALLAQAAAAPSVDAGNRFLEQAQTILFEDLPVIPLWYSNATGGYSTQTVQDVQFAWNSVPIYEEVTSV